MLNEKTKEYIESLLDSVQLDASNKNLEKELEELILETQRVLEDPENYQ